MSVINNQALARAKTLVKENFGDISDLSPELQNTITNIYYKVAQHLLNREDGESFPRSALLLAEDLESGYKKYIEESTYLVKSAKALPEIIASLREDVLKRKSRKDIELITFALLCLFKYRVPNAMRKSALRLKFECWLRRSSVDEIENLYQLFL